MITRLTENMKFNMLTGSVSTVQAQYGTLMEKISTQKNINRPSDDPVGTNNILNYRTALASIEQYQSNITDATTWLKLSETNISGLRDIVDQAQSIVTSETGASGSAETRAASLTTLTALIDQALSLMNAQSGDNYIFGGSVTDEAPFSSQYAAASASVSAESENVFDGVITGTYTGTENKSYLFRITGGTVSAASYEVSADGGKSWTAGASTVDLSTTATTIDLGGGLSVSVGTAGTDIEAGDTFKISATAAGYYQGNDDNLYTVVGQNNNMAYNVTGADAFTGQFASAEITGAGVSGDYTIVLTRGATPDSWSITSPAGATITSQTAESLTIDTSGVTGLGANNITVSLTGTWEENNTISLSLADGTSSGDAIPTTFTGSGKIDLLSTLNALKEALALPASDQDRAVDLISAQLDNLESAGTQLLQYETQVGAKQSTLEVTSSNHDSMDLQITNMLSDIESADMTSLITEFQMKEIALEASYNMASQIGKLTIMDYL